MKENMTTPIKGYMAENDIIFKTGFEVYHSPLGWRVFLDSSWSNIGNNVAAKKEDIEIISRSNFSSLGEIRIKKGSLFLLGNGVFHLLVAVHGSQASLNSWAGLLGVPKREADVEIITIPYHNS